MLALRGARVFDGDRRLTRSVVLIDGSTIVDVVDRAPEVAEVVELGDVTLLPGLIDCHQHLCFDGDGPLEQQVAGIDDAALAARARANGQRALAAGITTVRDLGDRNYLTLELGDEPDLPTVVAAGPPITRRGGHCWYLGGECDERADLVAAVRERAERGCAVVKVMATGGGLTPTTPVWESQFDREALGAIVTEAERFGLPVAAHCHGNQGVEDSLDAGVHSIEHCTFISESGECEPPPGLLSRVAASDIYVSATMGLLPGAQLPPFVARNRSALRQVRRELVEHGAHLVAGTDAGISAHKPHDVLPHAIDELVDAGMSSMAALRSLTSVAARACLIDDRKGRLASGYDADVIAVRGDPAHDVAALLDIAGVWRTGTRVR